MLPSERLRDKLITLDGKGYTAYKTIAGEYRFPTFVLYIDHVQQDPFATPSLVRVRMDMAECQFPPHLWSNRVRKMALEDFITRQVHSAIRRFVKGHRGTGRSGMITVDVGGQEVLPRTSCLVHEDYVEVRLSMGLPGDGRRIQAKEAMAMFFEELPKIVEASLVYRNLDPRAAERHVNVVEDQEALREQLPERGLVAFVADDSVLPRESGVSDRPLRHSRVVRFTSPEELRCTLHAPNRGQISGMGIPRGVTLIVGGGYHGKSTLLQALQRAVYPHIPGDGREYVVTVRDAVKIRAEDGRRIEKVDISPFISNLPFGEDTTSFCTENASGSTSQAANIMEALEAGTSLLLMDEDTCATNFMIRDEMMQRLVPKEKEPITPFIDQVRRLYEEYGVSTILVMGGSGDYFEVADVVIMMDCYRARVVTAEAKRIASERQDRRVPEGPERLGPIRARVPLAEGFNPYRGKRVRVEAKGLRTLLFGREVIDLWALEQLVDESQTRAIGEVIVYALEKGYFDGESSLGEILDRIEEDIQTHGLEVISPWK
ncbi:MAG: ABC-ATPase domain-containing protein, partial [Armatimonadota bacterium]|nr:ABC-ATPase domain-containing protein [Armatimonadota bacterium]